MSDEYIKKEDAVNLFEALADSLDTFEFGMAAIGAANELRKMPSMCFAPVRHGRWIEMSYDEYKCSACEKVVREEILYAIKPSDREDDPIHIANYCPNCGAKMDEDNK